MQNIFENPAFSMSALTAAINILPNNYDRLAQMGLFVDRPQRFRSIIVEKQNNVLTLLPRARLPRRHRDSEGEGMQGLGHPTVPE